MLFASIYGLGKLGESADSALGRSRCGVSDGEVVSRSQLRRSSASAWSTVLFGTALLVAPQAQASSIYAPWLNGPPTAATFFPIAVWWQNPALTGHSGSYASIAAAASAMRVNTFLGLGGWPEAYGVDQGELEAAKANDLYVIGGINTPWSENTSSQSVSSVLKLAASIGAQRNVIGYNVGDEPDCAGDNGQLSYAQMPAALKQIATYDPTRVYTFNQTFWAMQPYWWGSCGTPAITELRAVSVGSFDYYPLTNANLIHYDYTYPGYLPTHYYAGKSDFRSVPNDTLWVQGVATRALVSDERTSQPTWVYIEAGGDNLGLSASYNALYASLSAGSPTLVNASGWSSFTTTWVGLTVSGAGIPSGTKISAITDGTHAVMSKAATSTQAHANISVTGGTVNDCVSSANLCVVNGNEYRPTPAQVNAEVWMSIINGANGIEYFCHDLTSDSFCMGDAGGGTAAAQTQANLHSIDNSVLGYAAVLNQPTNATCSMQSMNATTGVLSTSTSCTSGSLQMATSLQSVPGMTMLKTYRGVQYVFAQSDRRSVAGAAFTFTLTGSSGKTALIAYDSNTVYDPGHSAQGKTLTINGAFQFADTIGANHDDYQVKIYKIK